MDKQKTPLIDQWPDISQMFSEIENLEIEPKPVRIFYKSFFIVMKTPEHIAKSFYNVLTHAVL